MRIECPKLTAKVAAKVAAAERAACVETPSLCRVELPDFGATRADSDTAAVAIPVYRTNVGVKRPQ
jgi:imidazolonepropionase-like amidohydrolase